MNTQKPTEEKTKDNKVIITFTYAGQLDFSIEGKCTVEMTETEFEHFRKVNQQARDAEADDILAYFEEQMSESLYRDIQRAIEHDIRYQEAAEKVKYEGINCFEYMSEAVYDAMTEEELIERFMDDNFDGLYEYLIQEIEIEKGV